MHSGRDHRRGTSKAAVSQVRQQHDGTPDDQKERTGVMRETSVLGRRLAGRERRSEALVTAVIEGEEAMKNGVCGVWSAIGK